MTATSLYPLMFYTLCENFEEGKLKNYYEHWKKYTSDTFIHDIIKNGLKLDFNEIPFQHCCNNFPLSKEEMSIINSEIQKLNSKRVIVNTDKRIGNYISGVFTKSKKDGSHRIILNLKNFNKSERCILKMHLKDAYYSVPAAAHHLKYLKLQSLDACQMGMVLP